MKIIRTVEMAHPILKSCIDRIQRELIDYHSIPMKIFETGRVHDRHNVLINRGKTKDIMSDIYSILKTIHHCMQQR